MSKLIIPLVIIVTVMLAFVGFFANNGMFASVKIEEKKTESFMLAYKKHTGDYRNVGPVMDEVYDGLVNKISVKSPIGFGLYYDNPKRVKTEKLRSVLGCIVADTNKISAKIKELYSLKELPASNNSIVVEFPYKGVVSIIIGAIRVYPEINAYISNHNYPRKPIMEIYDKPNGIIKYIVPNSISDSVFADIIES